VQVFQFFIVLLEKLSPGSSSFQMSEQKQKPVVRMDPACGSAVAALEDDPFYRSICGASVSDAGQRRAVLEQYFDYSIQEGRDIGRCVHLEDRTRGVAVWLLPQTPEVQARAAKNKRAFLERALDAEGCANYYRIVDFMHGKAVRVVHGDAWYLSIVAVDPALQGQGLGRKLLELTIVEADGVGATCYLETFSARNPSFYERLGFATKARFTEPTTGAEYAVMVRYPKARTEKGSP
jgi:ribosomal protein S18 acetylase RimI-like enzyme